MNESHFWCQVLGDLLNRNDLQSDPTFVTEMKRFKKNQILFLVVVIQEIVSTTLNRSGGNELQLITKMPMCNIEMGFFMGLFFKVCRQKKTVITNHLDDEGIFF